MNGRWTAVLLLPEMLALSSQTLSPRWLSVLRKRNQSTPSLDGDAEASARVGTRVQKDNDEGCLHPSQDCKYCGALVST
jgi:hypothetical protein